MILHLYNSQWIPASDGQPCATYYSELQFLDNIKCIWDKETLLTL